MIIIESRTEGIKFERHKETKEQIEENKPYIFNLMILHYNECKLFITFSALHAHCKENENNVFRK